MVFIVTVVNSVRWREWVVKTSTVAQFLVRFGIFSVLGWDTEIRAQARLARGPYFLYGSSLLVTRPAGGVRKVFNSHESESGQVGSGQDASKLSNPHGSGRSGLVGSALPETRLDLTCGF